MLRRRAQFLPIGDLAGVDVLELVEAEFVDRVFGIHDRNKRVDRDGGTDGIDALLAASSFSLPLMSREDMAMLASPSSRALMPLPEPPPESADLHVGIGRHVASDTFCIMGNTVVEPLTTISSAASPERAEGRTGPEGKPGQCVSSA